MYGGVDKYAGVVVGQAPQEKGDFHETLATSNVDETLVMNGLNESGEPEDLLVGARINPQFGGVMWVQEKDLSSTYKSVVAMSQMTSMMHDTDRNEKYDAAITEAVQRFTQEHGRAPHVLDIGAGTGLLSMMAVRAGAAHVTACEMFPTMAGIAATITQTNCGDKITVIAKRSTDLTVGPGGDMTSRADMLVTEIFDSVLLGEGVIPTVRHAIEHLLVPGAEIVPRTARMYIQIVESDNVRRYHDLSRAQLCDSISFSRNPAAANCSGGSVALPLHVAALKPAPTPLTPEQEIFQFDFFTPPSERATANVVTNTVRLPVVSVGVAHAVLLRWELDLGCNGVTYSTAPGAENWQDHWVQALFPLGRDMQVEAREGETLTVLACHNDLNVWFAVGPADASTPPPSADAATAATGTASSCTAPDVASEGVCVEGNGAPVKRPKLGVSLSSEPRSCVCGMHTLANWERLAMLNDRGRCDAFQSAISSALDCMPSPSEALAVDVSDGSLCALLAAAAGCAHVVSLESKLFSGMLFAQIAKGNNVLHAITFLQCGADGLQLAHLQPGGVDDDDEDEEKDGGASSAVVAPTMKKIDLLMGEPFFYQMQNRAVWQALNFWFIRSALSEMLSPSVEIIPCCAVLRGVVVELDELWVSHGAVGDVSGFDHSHLDGVQTGWNKHVFNYPMWMYGHKQLSAPFDLLHLDYTSTALDASNYTATAPLPPAEEGGEPGVFERKFLWKATDVPVVRGGKAHAVMVWVDYKLDMDNSLSTGVREDGGSNYWKQSLQFFALPVAVSPGMVMLAEAALDLEEANIDFTFEMKEETGQN